MLNLIQLSQSITLVEYNATERKRLSHIYSMITIFVCTARWKFKYFVNSFVDIYQNKHRYFTKRTCCHHQSSKSIIGLQSNQTEKLI